jgi:hypothetical protein
VGFDWSFATFCGFHSGVGHGFIPFLTVSSRTLYRTRNGDVHMDTERRLVFFHTHWSNLGPHCRICSMASGLLLGLDMAVEGVDH